MQQVPCGKCGNKIDVPDPKLELINQVSVSMIVWAHSEPSQCAVCGNVLIGIIPSLPIEHIKTSFAELPNGMADLPNNVKAKPQPSRIISLR